MGTAGPVGSCDSPDFAVRWEAAPVAAGMLARAPRATGKRRSTWLAVDKGWLK
jgi:hypothetical protein